MAKAFRVDAGFDNPDVSRTFLWIQFGVFTGLNAFPKPAAFLLF